MKYLVYSISLINHKKYNNMNLGCLAVWFIFKNGWRVQPCRNPHRAVVILLLSFVVSVLFAEGIIMKTFFTIKGRTTYVTGELYKVQRVAFRYRGIYALLYGFGSRDTLQNIAVGQIIDRYYSEQSRLEIEEL